MKLESFARRSAVIGEIDYALSTPGDTVDGYTLERHGVKIVGDDAESELGRLSLADAVKVSLDRETGELVTNPLVRTNKKGRYIVPHLIPGEEVIIFMRPDGEIASWTQVHNGWAQAVAEQGLLRAHREESRHRRNRHQNSGKAKRQHGRRGRTPTGRR